MRNIFSTLVLIAVLITYIYDNSYAENFSKSGMSKISLLDGEKHMEKLDTSKIGYVGYFKGGASLRIGGDKAFVGSGKLVNSISYNNIFLLGVSVGSSYYFENDLLLWPIQAEFLIKARNQKANPFIATSIGKSIYGEGHGVSEGGMIFEFSFGWWVKLAKRVNLIISLDIKSQKVKETYYNYVDYYYTIGPVWDYGTNNIKYNSLGLSVGVSF